MGTPCAQTDCDGTIADDGYCDECGRAPSGPSTPTAAAAPSSGSGPSGAAGPRHAATTLSGSAPTGSAPTGSAPTGSSATGSAPTASVSTGSRSTGSVRTGSRHGRPTSSRRRIGGGLVEITPAPRRNPAEAVLTDPVVPERARYCGQCDQAVGRSHGDRPGRAQGFCPQCGTRFSFVPTLAPGDLVADQYEILGALAHGGLGWIYLALDKAVDDRWVVLKGLIDTRDEAALAAAIAERGYLARLEHPRIVRIYNMVTSAGDAGQDSVGYLVMEYVDGRSLRQMREQREHREPMPPDQALAYVLEVLPALSYVHEQELLYCDFKPDNVVQTGTEVKLIDLGAVRRMDDVGGDVWGTVGYQAPEIRENGPGPSVASDVYTVGRALAVLIMNFDFSRTFVDRLPEPVDAPVLAEHDGLRRLLARATALDAAGRFGSIPELSEQMTGVLRQVVATGSSDGPPPPRPSTVFGPPRRAVGTDVDAAPDLATLAAALPTPLVDADDAAAPVLAPVGAAPVAEKLAALTELARMGLDTEEARRLTVIAHAEAAGAGGLDGAGGSGDIAGHLETAGRAWRDHRVDNDPWWTWAGAVLAAARRDVDATRTAAEGVVDALPGELAPWLLAAVAAEHHGDIAAARRRYELVWRTDRGWIDAAFGVARTRLADGDREGAVAALDDVPATSVHHVEAQVAAIRLRVGGLRAGAGGPGAGGPGAGGPGAGGPGAGGPGDEAARSVLADAGRRCADLDIDDARRAELECDVLEAARDWLGQRSNGSAPTGAPTNSPGNDTLLGCALDERGLGFGIEDRYRARAHHAPDTASRIALVDQANHARPWTRV